LNLFFAKDCCLFFNISAMLILGLSDTRFPFQKKTLADQERMTINAQRSLQRFYVQKNSIPCFGT
jgi:hypothetical protein